MRKVIVIGCPGAGKSTFARKLAAKTGLPLHYLDMIWHLPDRTTLPRDEFLHRLEVLTADDEWIIDGNYLNTMAYRLQRCDTVFLFDLPVDVCLAGAESRLGKDREDMPWTDSELDPDFRRWIEDFQTDQLPVISTLLQNRAPGIDVVVFKTRSEADAFIDSL